MDFNILRFMGYRRILLESLLSILIKIDFVVSVRFVSVKNPSIKG